MKKLRIIFYLALAVIIVNCSLGSDNPDMPSVKVCFEGTTPLLTAACETGGTCSFTFFEDSRLNFIEEAGKVRSAVIVSGNERVFRFQQILPPSPTNTDTIFRAVYFEMDPLVDSLMVEAQDLRSVNAFAELQCGVDCSSEIGTFFIEKGCIESIRLNNFQFDVRLDVEVNRLTNTPVFERIFATFSKG